MSFLEGWGQVPCRQGVRGAVWAEGWALPPTSVLTQRGAEAQVGRACLGTDGRMGFTLCFSP